MHRIFSGGGWLAFLGIRKSQRDHRRSQPLVQQPLVLIILCILCIHVQYMENRSNPTGSLFPIGHADRLTPPAGFWRIDLWPNVSCLESQK